MSDSNLDESLPFDACMVSDNTPLARNPDLVAAPMDGELVMMSIESGKYYGVGGIGPRVWELLAEPVTVGQITAAIVEEFEVEPETCRTDILRFIGQLLEAGLVRSFPAKRA